jgi:hypothetical protein
MAAALKACGDNVKRVRPIEQPETPTPVRRPLSGGCGGYAPTQFDNQKNPKDPFLSSFFLEQKINI